jgi:hypothetical protein
MKILSISATMECPARTRVIGIDSLACLLRRALEALGF